MRISSQTNLISRFFVTGTIGFPVYLEGYAIVDDALANLQVDSHVILAEDDPIIPVRDAKFLAQSPHLKITTVKHGGHCGFLDRLHTESWIDRTVAGILART